MKSELSGWVLIVAVSMLSLSFLSACQHAQGSDDDVAVIAANADCLRIASDELLTEGVKFAIKDYPGVNAYIEKGVITLSGSIEKHNLPELMMVLKSLRASKIVNHLSVK